MSILKRSTSRGVAIKKKVDQLRTYNLARLRGEIKLDIDTSYKEFIKVA